MNFKSLLFAGSIGLVTLIGGSAPVQAEVHRGGHIQNYYTPYIYESSNRSSVDQIHVEGPNGLEVIQVRCAPYDWESHGPNSANFVDRIAKSWCF